MSDDIAMRKNIGISKWVLLTIIGVLIAAGTNNTVFTCAAALLASAGIVLYDEQNSLGILFFTMPYTHIFKIAPGTVSVFVVLLLLYVMWYMLRMRLFHRVVGEILVLCAFVSAVHFASGMLQISQLIKFMANLLFLYVAVQEVDFNNPREIFLVYIYGLLTSSFLKYSGAFPNVPLYTDEHLDLDRFTGMHADPNFYGFNVVLALCLVVIMYHRRDISVWMTIALTGVLVWFATLTVSKMVFIMLAFPCLIFFYSNCVNRRIFLQFVFIAIITALILLVISGKIDAFDAVLKRFERVNDAASLTTGRSIKWRHYIQHIFGSLRVTLIGEGLNAPYTRASDGVPHNTYIDFLYNLGLGGTMAYIACILHIFKLRKNRIKRTIINGILLTCIMVMWMSLSELLYFDFPFHLLLGYIVWNLPMDWYSKKHSKQRVVSRYGGYGA